MHIHLDLVGGIAGDMFLAAALDAGLVEAADLQGVLQTVGLGPVEVVVERVRRGALAGTHIRFTGWDPAAEADHRHLSTILEMIDASGLDARAKAIATSIFGNLGRVEARIHDIDIEHVHFHEVGAVDSILDICGAAFVISSVDATWSCGQVPTGTGLVRTAHGSIPLPVPASLALLEGFVLADSGIAAELVTPTGAAILANVVTPAAAGRGGTRPSSRMVGAGYGCGTRELAEIANVLRLTRFENVAAPAWSTDTVVQLVTEIDDMTAELLAAAVAQLMELGALDVVRDAVTMKKGRLGTRLSVLCHPDRADTLAEAIFLHTTTFGVRRLEVDRLKLRRDFVEVETRFGRVRVKRGYSGDVLVQATPEYESVALRARESGATPAEVYAAALAASQSPGAEDGR